MIVGHLSSAVVFCGVLARTENINVLVAISQKLQKERTQLCIECECQLTN